MKKFFDKTFFKFIIVGVLNTLFGTTVMLVCYNLLHIGYWVSSAANYILGSILSYFLNKNFTFSNKEKGIKPILRFTVNIIVCYGLAYGIAKPLVKIILSPFSRTVIDNCAMLAGSVFFIGFNYIGQRFFAFKEK